MVGGATLCGAADAVCGTATTSAPNVTAETANADLCLIFFPSNELSAARTAPETLGPEVYRPWTTPDGAAEHDHANSFIADNACFVTTTSPKARKTSSGHPGGATTADWTYPAGETPTNRDGVDVAKDSA
ncbi:hypothetical protein [Amycolatopsis sp. NPDC054798]